MDVIIVIHTEFGRVINKKVVAIKDPNGFKESVINMMNVTDKYGAKNTFVVCPEVVPYFPIGLDCEIGLHIHPGWQEFKVDGIRYYVGDEFLKSNCKQSSDSTVLRDYSFDEQNEMIHQGRQYIFQHLRVMPQTFVSGRWSINNDTVKALVINKMTRDCSAVSHTRKSHYDWSNIPKVCLPYHPNENNYQSKGQLPILEIPISQMFVGNSVNPEMARLFGVDYLKLNFEYYYLRGIPLFHICLHLPCMMDDYYISVMDNLLKYITKHKNIHFKFAREIEEYN